MSKPIGNRWNDMLLQGSQLGIYESDERGILLKETIRKQGNWREGSVFYAKDAELILIQRMELLQKEILRFEQMDTQGVDTLKQRDAYILAIWTEFRHSLYQRVYELNHNTDEYATFLSPKQIERYVDNHMMVEEFIMFLFDIQSNQLQYPHRKEFLETWHSIGELFFEELTTKRLPFHTVHEWMNTCEFLIDSYEEHPILAIYADAFLTLFMEEVTNEDSDVTISNDALLQFAIEYADANAIKSVAILFEESEYGLVNALLQPYFLVCSSAKKYFKTIEKPPSNQNIKPIRKRTKKAGN